MIKKLSLLIASFFILSFALMPAIAGAADPCDQNKDGTITTQEAIRCGTDNAAGAPDNAKPSLDTTIHNIVNVLSIVVGIAAVIMIMVGGLRYVTSGGKEDSIKGAKNTIVYALIGLIVVALAQVVVRFVLNKTI